MTMPSPDILEDRVFSLTLSPNWTTFPATLLNTLDLGDTLAVRYLAPIPPERFAAHLEQLRWLRGRGVVLVAHLPPCTTLSMLAAAAASDLVLLDPDFSLALDGDRQLDIVQVSAAEVVTRPWLRLIERNPSMSPQEALACGIGDLIVAFPEWCHFQGNHGDLIDVRADATGSATPPVPLGA